MPYRLDLPNGSYTMVPDNVSMEEAIQNISKANPEMFRGTPKSGVGASFSRGLKSLAGDAQTLYEMGRYGSNEAGKRSLERQRELDEQYAPATDIHRLGQSFDTGIGSGLAELGRQGVGAIAENVPLMATMALTGGVGGAAMRGAQMTGRGLGALAGAYAPRVASNVTAQAGAQEAENKPINIDVGKAMGTAAVQAPLDVAAQILPLGGKAVTSMFGPEVANLLRMGNNAAADDIAKNYLKAAMRGVKVNLMEQLPIQVVQTALQRAQTGQSLTSDDAMSQYGQAMYTATLMSPMGAIGGMSDRAEAIRKREEIKNMGPPKPPNYDFMGPPKPPEEANIGPPKPPDYDFMGPPKPAFDQAGWERLHGEGFMGPLKPREQPQPPDVMYGTSNEEMLTSPDSLSGYEGRRAAEAQHEQLIPTIGPPKPPDYQYPAPAFDQAGWERLHGEGFMGPLKPREQPQPPDVMYGTSNEEMLTSPDSLSGYEGRRAAEAQHEQLIPTIGPPKPPDYDFMGPPNPMGPEQPPIYDRAVEAVRKAGKASVKIVKDAAGVESHVAVMLLDKMERAGLVSKPDAANRRKVTTKLTNVPEVVKTPAAPIVSTKPVSDFVQKKIAEKVAAKPIEATPNVVTEGQPVGKVESTAVGEGTGVPIQERATEPSSVETTQPTGVGSTESNVAPTDGGAGTSTRTLGITPKPRIKPIYTYTPNGENAASTAETQDSLAFEARMSRRRARDAAVKKAADTAEERAKEERRQITEENPAVVMLRNAHDIMLKNKKEKDSLDGLTGLASDHELVVKAQKAFESLPKNLHDLDPQAYEELASIYHDVTKAYYERYSKKSSEVSEAKDKARQESGRQERDNVLNEIEENSKTNPDGLSGERDADRILLNRFRKALADINHGASEDQIADNLPHVLTRAKMEQAFRKRYPETKAEQAAPIEVNKRRTNLEDEEDRESVGRSGSSSVDDVEHQVRQNKLGKLLTSGKLTIVDNVDELPPRADGKPHNPNKRGAVFGRGKDAKAFIVAGNIHAEDVMGVLLHEVGAHIGLEDMLPPHEYQQILKDFETQLNKKSPAFVKAMERAQSKIPEGTPNRAERIKSEALAYLIEHTKAPALVQRILSTIRQFANKWLGTNFTLNEHDLRAMAMAAARGIAKEGEEGESFFTGPRESAQPKDVRYSEADAEELHDVGKALDDYAEPTTGLLHRVKAALMDVPGILRDTAHGFASLHQIGQLYGDKIPAFRAINSLMNRRGAERNMRHEAIKDTMLSWWKDVKGIPSDVMNEFHDIALRSSMYQVELEDGMASGMDVNTNSPLYAQYKALTSKYPQLANIYRGMRDHYDAQSKEFEQYCLEMVSPNAAQKMKAKFAASRIGVYMPFFRRGDYWVTYTDKDGIRVSQAYETKLDQKEALNKAKLVSTDAEAYRKLRDLRNNTGAPAGLMGEVLEEMAKQGVAEETLDNVYETFLNYMPNAATMQRYRARENRHGMIRDTLQTFATLAPAMSRNLTNLKYAKSIEDEVINMRQQVDEHKSDDNITSAARNVEAQIEFMRKPAFNKLVNTLGYGSYMWYLAGNASSAFVNFTHMPMVVYPLLAGEHGFDKTSVAMFEAMKKFSVKGKIPAEYEELFKAAHETGVMGKHLGSELAQFRDTPLEKYNGMFSRVNRGLNFMFESADRLNRESTLVAAYELAGGKANHEEAFQKAADMVSRAFGTNLAETGPRFMQNGFARVALTFKRFAMNRFFIMGRLFNEAFRDEDVKTREIARKQLLGLYGTAFLFSGVAGMPLVGAGEMLASQLFSNKDETYDAEEELKNSIGLLAYKGPIGYLTNLEISSRTGWGDMLWKDDPKRLAEIGPMLYTAEHLMGPAYSAMVSAGTALQHFSQGEYSKGFEAMTPSSIRNVLKAYRYAAYGVVNKNGAKVVDDVNAWNVMMQGLGFAPLDVTEARAGASMMTTEAKKITTRRGMLIDQMYGAQVLGNDELRNDIQDEIDHFNEVNPEVRITPQTIMQSYMQRQKKAEDAVDGVTLPPKLKERLTEKFHRGD